MLRARVYYACMMSTATIRIVIDVESDPPRLLGTLLPWRDDDECVVRYFDSGANEEEHIAPEDCVRVLTVEL